MTPEPVASVVIPALNAASEISEQLAALVAQELATELEVIVVDNGSTDATREVAAGWCDRLPLLRIIRSTERAGPAHARNVGIAAASTDNILLCDADDVVYDGWARALLTALQSVDAVAGRVIPWNPDESIADTLRTRDDDSVGARFDFLPAFGSNNAGFKRHVWEAVGQFREDLLVAEDIDLGWRMQLAGFRLGRQEDAIVFARERATNSALFRQAYRYGLGHVWLFSRYRGDGMPRSSSREAVKQWAALLVFSYRLTYDEDARRRWCRRSGWRCGRLVGSLRHRTLYL